MGFESNSYINAIISTVAKYHAVSPEGLLKAWNEMEQYKDICYAKTAYDIINALGWLADWYAVYGEKSWTSTTPCMDMYRMSSRIP